MWTRMISFRQWSTRPPLKAIEEGKVRPHIMDQLELGEANLAFDRLRGGEVLGRLVVRP
jgi:D-arabinose 1-dehydrogenase-like Zn-dependent alcohol dehydrogenase